MRLMLWKQAVTNDRSAPVLELEGKSRVPKHTAGTLVAAPRPPPAAHAQAKTAPAAAFAAGTSSAAAARPPLPAGMPPIPRRMPPAPRRSQQPELFEQRLIQMKLHGIARPPSAGSGSGSPQG
jgi:hypothetical protein